MAEYRTMGGGTYVGDNDPGSYGPNDNEWREYQRRMAELQKREQAASERPDMPEWRDTREVGPDGLPGLLRDPYRLSDPSDMGMVGVDLLRDEATRTGPSAWRQLEQASQMDQLARRTMGQTAQAQNQLAMRGGLRGGGAERLAATMGQQQLTGGQDIAMKTALEDERRRMQAMGQLPGAELALGQFQQGAEKFNIATALDEEKQRREAEQKQYEEQMRAWGAERTAAATPSSGGGGGCFITTAVCEKLGLPDDNPILNTFREFRDEHMGGKDAVGEYYEVAPKIVGRIEELGADDVYYDLLANWLIPALKCIHTGDLETAERIYSGMVEAMKKSYLKGEE